MTEDYKEYNNYSQKEKESMMAANTTTSNQNEATIIGDVDDVETLLGDIKTELANIKSEVTAIKTTAGNIYSRQDTINTSVNTQGQAIVAAIQGQQ